MKITEIRIDIGETVGLPNYSSAKIQAGVSVQIEEGENPTEAKRKAIDWVMDTVQKEIDRALILAGQPSKYNKVNGIEGATNGRP